MMARLHLLRYVSGASVLHRANARSKVLALTVTVFALSFDPVWSSLTVVWGGGLVAFVAARLPRGVLPRPPRLLLWAMGLALVFGLAAGGEPFVDLAGTSVGLGGLILQLRFFAVTLGLLWLALLLGWTTPLSELPRAAAWMLAPLRVLRIPTDDVVAGLTLAVRALPLMADELATTTTLWGLRPNRHGNRIVEAIDLAATATTAATRRAAELGETLANRGPVTHQGGHGTWGPADVVVAIGAAAALGAIVVL